MVRFRTENIPRFFTKVKNWIPPRPRQNIYAITQTTMEFIPLLAKPALDEKTYGTDSMALAKRLATITAVALVAIAVIAANFEVILPLVGLTFVPIAFFFVELWRSSRAAKQIAIKHFQSQKTITSETMEFISQSPKAASLLVANKTNLDKRDEKSTTLLHHVSDPKVAQILINGKARIDLENEEKITALEKAVANIKSKKNPSASEKAIAKKKLDLVKIFLKDGVGVDVPHHKTAIWRHVKTAEVVELLHSQQFKVNQSKNALIWGAHNGIKEVVEKLLELNADPHVLDEKGQNALHRCTEPTIVEHLVKGKVDLELTDKLGHTPLYQHLFSLTLPKKQHHIGVALNLLKAGAQLPKGHILNTEPQLPKGYARMETPLTLAIKSGYTGRSRALVDAILEKKPDTSEKNGNGEDPLSIAKQKVAEGKKEYEELVKKLTDKV